MKTAIYARVSTDEQTEQNQVNVLEKWAAARGFEVEGVYRDIGSAWQHSDQRELRRLFTDCDRGKIQMVLVYDLSRFSRRGPLELLLTLKRFADYHVQVNSYLETWFNAPSEFQPVLVSIWGYFAQLYSKQLSERTKAGMERAKAAGKHVGRPRKTKKARVLRITDIFSKSVDILGSRFYVVRFDPISHPLWVKLGITRNLRQHFEHYLTTHPCCELVGSWQSPNVWKEPAISHVIMELEGKPIGASLEFYEIKHWKMIVPILNRWFMRQLSKEKGVSVISTFVGLE